MLICRSTESILFLSSPKPPSFAAASLFLSSTRRARRRYLRDISLVAFTAFLRHGGGCGRLGLLPPQRSYCFSHPNHPPDTPRQPPRARNHLLPPAPPSRPSPRWRYHSIPSLLPPRRPPPPSTPGPARKRAPDRLLRHCA
ncbi:hypothetical protein PUN28_001070 [Cardiocondyla obscurior]|uniref:Uncharacterized protein n=1 Tax=Cardiocondyla obscurior TaxID=286306 RepID=A0AAW2H381_9HYME